MINNIYNDIPELNVRPYQLARMRETKSCTAKKEKEYGDVRFVQLDAVWHLFSHYPDKQGVIIYSTTNGVHKDGLKQAFVPNKTDWSMFCKNNHVDYWAYRDDVLPSNVR